MMNWILMVMATIASILIAMVVGGLMIPARVDIARCVSLAARREDVWRLVRAVDQIPDWCPSLPAFEVTAEQAPEMLWLRLRNDSQDIVGEWRVQFEESSDGQGDRTILTVFESSITTNPILRFLRSFGGRTGRVDRFLRAAAEQLGEFGAVPHDR